MTEQSSNILQTALAYYDHDGCCWRMSQGILPLGEQASLLRLPNWGTTVGGELYQQAKPSHLTNGHGCLSGQTIATPRSAMGDTRNQKLWKRPLDKPQNLENQLARLNDGEPLSVDHTQNMQQKIIE